MTLCEVTLLSIYCMLLKIWLTQSKISVYTGQQGWTSWIGFKSYDFILIGVGLKFQLPKAQWCEESSQCSPFHDKDQIRERRNSPTDYDISGESHGCVASYYHGTIWMWSWPFYEKFIEKYNNWKSLWVKKNIFLAAPL